MRRRAGALFIRDKKLLMLTGPKASFFWTPGGKLNEGESYKEALIRELDEELHITQCNINPYHTFSSTEEIFHDYTAPESRDEYFLVDTVDEIIPDREIDSAIWVTKSELAKLPLLNKFRDNVVTKLSRDDLI